MNRLLIFSVLFLSAASSQAAPHKLRVSDPALAQSLVARGGKLIADYGGFQLVEADDSVLANLDESRVERQDDFDEIKLNAKSLNTRTPEIRALRKSAGNFSGKHLHLVQFAGPVKPEWRTALERHGAHIVSYIPENAYLIYGDSAAIAKMQNWAGTNEFVQWEGAYAADYKIHPDARLVDANGNPQPLLTDIFSIQLVDDATANLATFTLIGQWQMDAIENEYALLGYRNIIVRLPQDKLSLIAAQPDVVSIQPYFEPEKLDERQDQIIAGNLTSSNTPSAPGYLAWLASKGFTQAQFTNSGFVVDLSDSGIDNGTVKPGHFGLYQLGSTSQVSRVAYNKLQGTAHANSTLRGDDGHGTLNSHIIAGYDNFTNAFPHTDSAGYFYGLGVCPFVKVGSSVVFDPSSFTNPNFTNLLTQAYTNGARISNNSWGGAGNGAYNSNAQTYDALVRDVGAAGQNRQMIVVFAAGNTATGARAKSIDSPGSAKNVITVGAAENVRSLSIANGGFDSAGDSACTSDSDTDANSANDIAGFSNRGPCADGRMKPDLVAPGTHITGGVEQISPS
ncbi:MAG TPA: S8 family serine peptidase, partial [Verrucomicrobiae bacterium]|nr:S8 family serine peptidase [Verrucomicrobiae bacterium]